MFVKIGSVEKPTDIVDLLLECHERIRTFIGIARRIAGAHDSPPREVGTAAARVTRYFSESLPLHVADEEQSILPRLQGKDPAIDAVLAEMHLEHERHEPQLEALLGTCRMIEQFPERLAEWAPGLAAVATALEQDFLGHLEKEEKVILPAIRNLASEKERHAMLHELRARRANLGVGPGAR
jgi:iron-sulfur cluster repair protein YtfE (RIC family)